MHRLIYNDAEGKPGIIIEISDEIMREVVAEFCKTTAEAILKEPTGPMPPLENEDTGIPPQAEATP